MSKHHYWILAPTFFLALATSADGQDPGHSKVITDKQALADAFHELIKTDPRYVDNRLRLEGVTVQDIQKQLAEANKRGLLLTTKETIQQVVVGSPSPQPILGGEVKSLVTNRPTLIVPLTPEETSVLLRMSASVGRIEVLDGQGGAKLIGTAFVINDGEVASNCHVIREITTSAGSGKDLLNPASLRVDFGDGPNHDLGREFRITGVSGCPSLLGLDVGILKVEQQSADGRNSLPAKLDLVPMAPSGLPGMRVALVGYPGLKNPRDPLYRALSSATYAKVLTLGTVLDVVKDTNAPIQYIHHSSDSESGNSGSPLFSLSGPSFRVIGVHNCCYDASTALPDRSLPCSFVRGVAHRNSAIATWILPKDPVLGPLLR